MFWFEVHGTNQNIYVNESDVYKSWGGGGVGS